MLPTTEKSILAIILDRPELADMVFSNLTADFFHGNQRVVFLAIEGMRERGEHADWTSVRDALEASLPAAAWREMMDTTRGLYPSGMESFLKEKISILKTERGKRRIIADIESIARKPKIDESDIGELGKTIQSLSLAGEDREATGIGDAINSYHEHIRADRSEITLGFPSLDRRIDGFNPGELITIMARAAVGKTFLLLNILNHLCSKLPYKIALFSLEMPKAAIVERLLEIYFGYSRLDVKAKSIANELVVYMPDSTPLTMEDFEARFGRLSIYDKIYSVSEIRRIVEREGYRIVCVDFLHLIRSEVIGSPYQQISQIIASMKQMAKDTDCVTFLLHQLSRAAGDGWTRVEMSMARDSGQIEELSDFIIGAWSPGLNPDAPDEMRNILRLSLAKNKRGERWAIDCRFDKESGRVDEADRRTGS